MTRRSPEVEAAQVEAVLDHAGVTRKKIAHELSTDEATISKIFNGKQIPHPLWWLRLGKLIVQEQETR